MPPPEPTDPGNLHETIEGALRAALAPDHFELRDESGRHAGHAGAAGGGGHFSLVIVSARFEGLSLIERHRLVNRTLGPLMGREIHALAMRTLAPSEWRGSPGT